MKHISRTEEAILLAILKLKNNAYGVSIRNQIHDDTGDKWSFALIYVPLEKLLHKGFIEKQQGDPSPERGGKSKYYYKVTSQGLRALEAAHTFHSKIWSGVPEIIND
ncbi:MAG: hypothetical protein GY863_06540 [bacterium]|nr:hypothetical protein [bacterium]